MKIVVSRKIADLVSRINRRLLKNKSTFYHRTDPLGFLCGMQTAVDCGLSGPDFIVVTVNQGVFGFSLEDKNEEQWYEYIKDLAQ